MHTLKYNLSQKISCVPKLHGHCTYPPSLLTGKRGYAQAVFGIIVPRLRDPCKFKNL
jgi:hypothetical protein